MATPAESKGQYFVVPKRPVYAVPPDGSTADEEEDEPVIEDDRPPVPETSPPGERI